MERGKTCTCLIEAVREPAPASPRCGAVGPTEIAARAQEVVVLHFLLSFGGRVRHPDGAHRDFDCAPGNDDSDVGQSGGLVAGASACAEETASGPGAANSACLYFRAGLSGHRTASRAVCDCLHS